jgi:hypothetical protein
MAGDARAEPADETRPEPADADGIAWERLSDGRVWRLKRGQHYHEDSKSLERAAEAAGLRMGKTARLALERIPRIRYWDEYAWVQFADHDVPIGSPCPCGSHELIRTHPKFARCPACGALLNLSSPREEREDEAGRVKAITRGKELRFRLDERFPLSAYSEIRFVASERRPGRERLYGCAMDPMGMPVLVWVQYALDDGERARGPDGEPLEPDVHRWPVAPFSALIDVRRLEEGTAPEPLAFVNPDDQRGPDDRVRLQRFSDATLVYEEELPGRERFYGHAFDQDGEPALIYVDYPLRDGSRLPDTENAENDLHAVYHWPLGPFGPMIDLSSLAR